GSGGAGPAGDGRHPRRRVACGPAVPGGGPGAGREGHVDAATAARAVVGPTIAESRPAFAPVPRPGPDAPNVLVIVLDDLGFAQLGCFGGDVDTPVVD